MLVLHGCDTTSCLYGIGKVTSLSKFKASSKLHEQAKVFHSDSAPTHDVIDAGEKALVLVYNGTLTDTLDSLRHNCFCEKVASKTSHIKPQSLLPTSAATKYHSLHVHLQVEELKGSAAEFIPETGDSRSIRRDLCKFKCCYFLLLHIC